MSDVLVEIANQGFHTITIEKASTGEPIASIKAGEPSKTFKLLDGSSVAIRASSPEFATVTLDGVEEGAQLHIISSPEVKELFDNQTLTISPSTSTILTLQSFDPSSSTDGPDGVKCGEVIVLPPEAS